eukprot:SAG31_NODE_21776_length_541_cov_0.755656_2_plen_44_part_01
MQGQRSHHRETVVALALAPRARLQTTAVAAVFPSPDRSFRWSLP